MTVRLATIADAAAVAKVQVTSYRTAYAPYFPPGYWDGVNEEEQTADWQEWPLQHPDDIWLAATENATVVGYVLARFGVYYGADGEVLALHVLPEHRNRGLGGRLLAAAVQGLMGCGCRSVGLSTLAGNPIRSWYEALGGVQVATTLDDAGEGWTVREVVFTWDDAAGLLVATRPSIRPDCQWSIRPAYFQWLRVTNNGFDPMRSVPIPG